jgi:cyclophilin family peptidyl-prolyl cis-trans isomerase
MDERTENSSRRRSREVTKPSMKTKIKRNKTAMLLAVVIVFMLIFGSLYVVLTSLTSKNDSNIYKKNSIAVINTSMGNITVELYEDKMPITTANFIKLANANFYNGLVFHRVIDNFMIQTGGFLPDGKQKSSPYGNIQFETSDVNHVDGAISMASTGEKVGGSAQFFICDGAQSSLDDKYAAFGKVIDGMDVVRAIAAVKTTTKYVSYQDWPINDVIINSITIQKQ